MNILVFNAGSSSLKFAVFAAETLVPVLRGQISGVGSTPRLEVSGEETVAATSVTTLPEAQHFIARWLAARGERPESFAGIGHRVVHGGTKYVSPIRVDDSIQSELEQLRALAPLNLPFGLDAMREMRKLAPRVPHIACFDTAFHATQPE